MKLPSFQNFAAVLVATALALYASAAPVAQLAWPGASARVVPGEVLMKFKPSMGVQQRAAAAQAWGHTVLAHLEPSGWTRVKLAAGQSVAEGLAVYQSDPQVEQFLGNIAATIERCVDVMPAHDEYVAKFCPAEKLS